MRERGKRATNVGERVVARYPRFARVLFPLLVSFLPPATRPNGFVFSFDSLKLFYLTAAESQMLLRVNFTLLWNRLESNNTF